MRSRCRHSHVSCLEDRQLRKFRFGMEGLGLRILSVVPLLSTYISACGQDRISTIIARHRTADFLLVRYVIALG